MLLETRISESGPYGVLVELHPYGSDGLFLYGHPEDKLFQLEYPKGFNFGITKGKARSPHPLTNTYLSPTV